MLLGQLEAELVACKAAVYSELGWGFLQKYDQTWHVLNNPKAYALFG